MLFEHPQADQLDRTLLPAVHLGLLPDPATIIIKKMDRAGRLDLVFTYLVSRATKVLLAASRERESQIPGWLASVSCG